FIKYRENHVFCFHYSPLKTLYKIDQSHDECHYAHKQHKA
ncbi:hypothetical protein ECEC1737_4513, partial [Escherichia coli EC1737]